MEPGSVSWYSVQQAHRLLARLLWSGPDQNGGASPKGEFLMALHHASSGEVVDLSPLGPELSEASTRALVKTDSFEAIRLVVPAAGEMPPHKVSGKFTLHCLEGHVRLELSEGSVELSANEWIFFDGGVMHSVVGIEDSSLLLTIMLPSSGSSGS